MPAEYWLALLPGGREPLDSMRAWLTQNNATVMAVLFLVIGVVMIGKGIAGL